jgi:hypothetical protein
MHSRLEVDYRGSLGVCKVTVLAVKQPLEKWRFDFDRNVTEPGSASSA